MSFRYVCQCFLSFFTVEGRDGEDWFLRDLMFLDGFRISDEDLRGMVWYVGIEYLPFLVSTVLFVIYSIYNIDRCM